MSRLSIVFMGTTGLARRILAVLADDPRYRVAGVVAQPDRPAGRSLRLTPPPVKIEAISRGLPVFQPARARDPVLLETLRALESDLIVVAAYGQILPQTLLELPRLGCLNVHTSLLPRWRGAAPIAWALAEGDRETGVTIMKMDAGLDTGPIVAMVRTPIVDADNGALLTDRLAGLGARLLTETIPGYASGEIALRAQPAEGVTYARKITRVDGEIDWRQPAVTIWRRVRAFLPWPGSFTWLSDGRESLLKILEAEVAADGEHEPGVVIKAEGAELLVACGRDALRVTSLQREGRRPLSTREFLAGGALRAGMVLGRPPPRPGRS